MNTDRNIITADLGAGSFELDRLTESCETAVNEETLLEGGFDRVIVGGKLTLVLEGRYGIQRDGSFFRAMTVWLKGRSIVNAVIGGVTYPSLYAAKAVLTEKAESGIGRYVITLKEL